MQGSWRAHLKRSLSLIVVAMAIVVSGCICFSPGPSPTPGPKDVNALPSIEPQLQASSSPQATTQSIHPFDPGRAQWMEYRVSEGGGRPYDLKLEYSESNANGGTRQSVKRTISASDTGSNNGYAYDSTTNTLNLKLSGSSSSSSTGVRTSVAELKAEDPALSSGDLAYVPSGTETVTVPKGTFNCDKYTTNFKGVAGTFWASSGIPVPVKIAYGTKIMELVDWG